MTEHRELLANFLGAPTELVSEHAAERFRFWLQQHDLETRQDELLLAIKARPEDETGWRHVRRVLAREYPRWSREQIEEWLAARLAYLPEREAKKRRKS